MHAIIFWQAYADDNTNYRLHVLDPDWLLEPVLEADNAEHQVGAACIVYEAGSQLFSYKVNLSCHIILSPRARCW